MADQINEEEILEAFLKLDKDGNGYLNAKELRKALKSLSQKLSKDEVKEIIASVDKDGDGRINIEEFYALVVGKLR